ncbi:hypothetical protein [Streptomyces sp. ZL-24]|uniref:hypothetical protein n=1 Tax=Streptomyces sp. ZL-24 TaxID=1933029 RepID=UPI0011B03CE8|nr:hypothetical protein [Streptomyces sp. ZL-24]
MSSAVGATAAALLDEAAPLGRVDHFSTSRKPLAALEVSETARLQLVMTVARRNDPDTENNPAPPFAAKNLSTRRAETSCGGHRYLAARSAALQGCGIRKEFAGHDPAFSDNPGE